jgi:hypothetical protein
MRVHHSGIRPFVRFTLPYHWHEVAINFGTPTDSGEGTPAETVPLERVTPEFVNDKVIELVNQLAIKTT